MLGFDVPLCTRMHSTIVITGAAGFIGSHLAIALLRRGHRIVGIDNFDPFYSRALKLSNVDRIRHSSAHSDRFELIEADIRDAKRMAAVFNQNQPVGVFHLAALAGVRPSIAEPARYVSVNLDGTTSVLEACRASGCQNIVFASSSSVYGNNRKVPFAEDDPVDEPISPYAATKRAGELICHTYTHLFGLRIAALRFFTVFGPAQRPDLAICKFMNMIAAGEEVPMFGDGSTSRDYTYIDDIISGVLAAADRVAALSTTGQGYFRIYNLGGSHPITLAELIEAIAKVVDRPARIRREPMQPGDVERTWADVARLNHELSLEFNSCLSDGLRQQWEHQRAICSAAGGR